MSLIRKHAGGFRILLGLIFSAPFLLFAATLAAGDIRSISATMIVIASTCLLIYAAAPIAAGLREVPALLTTVSDAFGMADLGPVDGRDPSHRGDPRAKAEMDPINNITVHQSAFEACPACDDLASTFPDHV